MSKVVAYSQRKSESKEIAFKYDPLGRRIEKRCEGKTTHFVWDGNTILHEWETTIERNSLQQPENENLVTWVYDDSSFTPSAKIMSEGNYSIISDYLGTPVEAYDEQGEKVWSVELDIYGRVKEFNDKKIGGYTCKEEFSVDFIPFRFQGQYSKRGYTTIAFGITTQIWACRRSKTLLAGGNPTLYGYVHDPITWIDPFGLSKKGGGFTIGANTAQQDVIARGVHFNVHGPGLPKKGRHLTLSPLKDATGKLTGNFELKSADVATSKLTSKQKNQISSQVTDYLQTDGNLKKLSETAKGALDKGGIKDPKRIQQLKDISSVLDDHIKNGTKPKCL